MTFSQIPGVLGDACRPNYREARQHFLDSANAIGCEINSYQHDQAIGLHGETLFCDVASFGPKHASNKILLTSGVHGVEGYCGSAMQILIMQSLMPHIDLENLQVIFVHAINPYGFSHYTRNNEDNVDLNRNFVSFPQDEKNNVKLTEFRDQAYPEKWYGSTLAEATKKTDQYIDRHCIDHFQTLMTQGQYAQAQDPYYGGSKESWSNKVWRSICKKYCNDQNQLIHLDFHTGLGPRGACELIYTGSQENYAKAQRTFPSGKIIAPGTADSSSPSISGPLCCGLLDIHPNAICVALEFGTVPIREMLSTLLEANWLHNNPECTQDEKDRIQQQTLNAFFIPQQDWLEQVWDMSEIYFMDALNSLSSHS